MQKNSIKAVIFDIGGVLEISDQQKPVRGHVNRGVHQTIAKHLNISLDQWFDAIDSTYSYSITGEMSEVKVLSTISKNTKISKTKLKKVIFQAYRTHFKPNKELYNLAFKLKKQGYKIAILSDQWHLSKQALMPKTLTDKFDVSIVSCDVGLRKPNPKIYKLTLKKLKLPAKNCVFIDNQIWNINPAQKLGMKTILYKDNKQVFRQLSRLGVK